MGVVGELLFCVCQCFAFFADHRVSSASHRPSGQCLESQRGPWRVHLAVRDLQPSKRLPSPPMSVPVQRTRRFRCVFDLWRCRRRIVPSSAEYSEEGTDSRGPSRLLEDIEQRLRHTAAGTDSGPLIVVKHFCKVSSNNSFSVQQSKASEPRGQRWRSPPQCSNRGGESIFSPPQ